MSAEQDDAMARARNAGFAEGVQWVTDEMVKVLRTLPGGVLVLLGDVLARALAPGGEAARVAPPKSTSDLGAVLREHSLPERAS